MEIVPNNSLLLVGVVPAVKDFEIARMLGWYRIPLRFAPKIIGVDYLAFYQGANFGEAHRWRIEYIAKYHGHELTTREELFHNERDHPRAHEEYYKIQLGPLIKVPQPIIAKKWKRLTFIYTTGELFNRADILNDLVVRSDDKDMLWRTLREKSQIQNGYFAQPGLEITVGPEIVDFILNFNTPQIFPNLEDY